MKCDKFCVYFNCKDAKEPTGDVFKLEVESETQEPGLQQDTETTLNSKHQPQSTGTVMKLLYVGYMGMSIQLILQDTTIFHIETFVR